MYVYGACLFLCLFLCDLWECVLHSGRFQRKCFFSHGVLNYVVCLCMGCDGCCVLCLYCEAWSCRGSYGKCECFVMARMGSVSVSS